MLERIVSRSYVLSVTFGEFARGEQGGPIFIEAVIGEYFDAFIFAYIDGIVLFVLVRL